MKVLQINAVPYGSTARIMFSLSDSVKANNGDCRCFYGFSWRKLNRTDAKTIGGLFSKSLHMILARLTGLNGFFSLFATRKLIRSINSFNPDIIHIHNLHGWYLNLPLFTRFLKHSDIPVVWTLHDCWSFTGHCPHYEMQGCEQWKTACKKCALYREYPQCIFDDSKSMFRKKKNWFTGFSNLTIVTPSSWLASQVSQSFLKDYPIKVIPNGIDRSVFRDRSNEKPLSYPGLATDKKIVLGVSFAWTEKKGIDVFIRLANTLGEQYQIVLVGTDEALEQQLPPAVCSIRNTADASQLAEIYSAADVFVNPTREETFPTVNMEALACGTPVITFRTGGSPEIIDKTCGLVIEKNDIDGLVSAIMKVCESAPFSKEACIKRAEVFDKELMCERYLNLYESVL